MLDRYRLQEVLGSPGAFGVTYYATDTESGRKVAIKELFPTDCMVRDPDGSGTLIPRSPDDAIAFQEALRMFEEEAKVLLNLRHENIVRALDFFHHDGIGTAYLVMQFEPGYSLGSHLDLQRPGRLNERELLKILDPLLNGLEAVHQMKYLHRDLKPSNIYITQGNKPILLDFGAARQVVVGRTRPLTMVLTVGFAPFEQYSKALKQGPYTDIYAMGAVLCYAITNAIPDAATDRKTNDGYVPLAKRLRGSEYSQPFLEAVDWALEFRSEDRPQTVAQWRTALHEGTQRPTKPSQKSSFLDRFRTRLVVNPPPAAPPLPEPPHRGAKNFDPPPRMPRMSQPTRVQPDHPDHWLRTLLLRCLILLLSGGLGLLVWWWMSSK